jgi:hypothetical protein
VRAEVGCGNCGFCKEESTRRTRQREKVHKPEVTKGELLGLSGSGHEASFLLREGPSNFTHGDKALTESSGKDSSTGTPGAMQWALPQRGPDG